MTVALSNRAFGFNQHKCTDAMSSIINSCDVPVNGSNPMNWKQGGKRVQGEHTYQIDIFRQNRPWPPPTKPRQSCEGWYKFILQHYDIYGAGWANYDWGQNSLMVAINPCCGWGKSKSKTQNRIFLPCYSKERSVSNSTSNIGSLTGWNFEYFHEPDENGYEVIKCSPTSAPVSLYKRLLILPYSGTHGSIRVLEREDAALTIAEFSARLVDHVILTVVVMDNILLLFSYVAWYMDIHFKYLLQLILLREVVIDTYRQA